MSLARRERRALAEMESLLRRSDPELDTTLAHWTTRGAQRSSALTFFRWRHARRGEFGQLLIVTVGLFVVICLAIVGVLTTSATRSAGQGRHSDCETGPSCGYARGLYTPSGR